MWKSSLMLVLLVACKSAPSNGDWSNVALDDTITSSVNSVNFEIRIPKGWKHDLKQSDLKGWRPDVEDYVNAPSVTVGYVDQAPQNLDEYISKLSFVGEPIVDKKILDANQLVVVMHRADNGVVRVEYVTHKGSAYVGCSAFHMKEGGVPNPKATAEWLEKICKTLAIK